MSTPTGSFTINTEAISGHGTDVGNLANEIRDKLGLMERRLQGLQGQWSGTASNQFAILYRDWARNANNMRNTLGDIGIALGRSADDYRTTERGVRSRFNPGG